MPLNYAQFAEKAINGQGYTQEEKDFITEFAPKLRAVANRLSNAIIVEEGQHEFARQMSLTADFINNTTVISADNAAQGLSVDWEENVDALNGLAETLADPDKINMVMSEADGEEGLNAEDLRRFLSITKDKMEFDYNIPQALEEEAEQEELIRQMRERNAQLEHEMDEIRAQREADEQAEFDEIERQYEELNRNGLREEQMPVEQQAGGQQGNPIEQGTYSHWKFKMEHNTAITPEDKAVLERVAAHSNMLADRLARNGEAELGNTLRDAMRAANDMTSEDYIHDMDMVEDEEAAYKDDRDKVRVVTDHFGNNRKMNALNNALAPDEDGDVIMEKKDFIRWMDITQNVLGIDIDLLRNKSLMEKAFGMEIDTSNLFPGNRFERVDGEAGELGSNDTNYRLNMRSEANRMPYLVNTYGANGKIPGSDTDDHQFKQESADLYNSITLTAPASLGEHGNTVLMLTSLGALFDRERNQLDKNYTTSNKTGTTSFYDFNTTFFFENIPQGDNRKRGYSEMMASSRQRAHDALEKYDEDSAEVKACVQNLFKYIKENLMHINTKGIRSFSNPNREVFGMLTEVIDDPRLSKKFGVDEILTENDKIQIRANKVMIDAATKFNDSAARLTTPEDLAKIEEAGHVVKEQYVKNAIMNSGIMNSFPDDYETGMEIKRIMNSKINKYSKFLGGRTDENAEQYLKDRALKADENGNLGRTPYYRSAYGINQDLIQYGYATENVTAEKVALGEVGGEKRIKDEFAGKIENMKIYKDMMACKDPVEMRRLTEQLEDKRLGDLGVHVDPDKKTEFMKNTVKINALYKEYDNDLEDAFSTVVTLEALDEAESELNSSRIGHKNSDEYNRLKEKMDELRIMCENAEDPMAMARSREYKNKLLEVYQASVDYQDKNRDKHGIAYDDDVTVPDSRLGGPRYRGAKIMEKFVEKHHYVAEDVAQKKALRAEKEAQFQSSVAGIRSVMNGNDFRNMSQQEKINALAPHILNIMTVDLFSTDLAKENVAGKKRLTAEEFRNSLPMAVKGLENRREIKALFNDKGMNAEKLAQLACAKHGRGLMSEVAKAEVKLKATAPQANNQPRRAPRAQNQGPNRH